MSTEGLNLKRAIEDLKLAIQQHWQKIEVEPDPTVRARMKQQWVNAVPELKALLEEKERLDYAERP